MQPTVLPRPYVEARSGRTSCLTGGQAESEPLGPQTPGRDEHGREILSLFTIATVRRGSHAGALVNPRRRRAAMVGGRL
jgi:hypothetical protein